MPQDTNDVGAGRTYSSPTKKYDAQQGTYSDNVEPYPQDDKLPLQELPQAPDPSPFKIGPMGGNADGGDR